MKRPSVVDPGTASRGSTLAHSDGRAHSVFSELASVARWACAVRIRRTTTMLGIAVTASHAASCKVSLRHSGAGALDRFIAARVITTSATSARVMKTAKPCKKSWTRRAVVTAALSMRLSPCDLDTTNARTIKPTAIDSVKAKKPM